MNTLEIKKLSVFDRLQIMESLWDSFMEENLELDSPEWHENILETRKKRIKNGSAEFISLNELKNSQK